jgi:hypothetical protein
VEDAGGGEFHAVHVGLVCKIDKIALERIRELADLIGQDLGRLTIADNTGQDLRQEMDRVMLATKRLLGYVTENFPDPRLPVDHNV